MSVEEINFLHSHFNELFSLVLLHIDERLTGVLEGER